MTRVPELEDDWALTVYQYARTMRWLCHHQRPAQNRRGKWASHIQGDPGFPDWTFLRDGRLVFAELKQEGKTPTADQRRWLDQLRRAGLEAYVWHPSDWPLVQKTLKRRPPDLRETHNVDSKGRV